MAEKDDDAETEPDEDLDGDYGDVEGGMTDLEDELNELQAEADQGNEHASERVAAPPVLSSQ